MVDWWIGRNVFRDGELERQTACAKYAHIADDGKIYQIEYYNLDTILSVGYRVDSRRGTQFRIWATGMLRRHLLQGYTLNERRLRELRQSVRLIEHVLGAETEGDEATVLLRLVTDYHRALDLLDDCDHKVEQQPVRRAGRLQVVDHLRPFVVGQLVCKCLDLYNIQRSTNLPIAASPLYNDPTYRLKGAPEMDPSEIRPRLVEQIWKSIAQSDVSTADIPPQKMEALVDAIASGVLVTLDETLDEVETPAKRSLEATAAEGGGEGEKVLWEGRPFLSLTTYYQITTERVRIVTGILGKDREDIELVRIQDIGRSQGITERMLGIGDIEIRSHDPSSEVAVLRNVRDPDAVNEILRRAMLDARKNSRYTIQEEM